MKIKTNLHLHTGDDPKDNIKYSTHEAIDKAKKFGFDALALTCHTKTTYTKEYADYANQKGILLIPGIEARIENRDVVILNCNETAEGIKTFEGLKKYKKENPEIFIMAPHPFVTSTKSLFSKLEQNMDLFDAIELTVFSNKFFNFNKKATKIAKKYNKPLVATSDTHSLKNLDKGYVIINAKEKSIPAIFQAIKNNQTKNKLQPFSTWRMLKFRINGIVRKYLS